MKFKYPQILMIILCAGLGLTLVSPPSVSAATIDIQVSQLSDDAEESGGSVNIDINDLEMGDKLCGIRFQGVTIPKGAAITRAYIQFTADYAQTGTSNLIIWGENRADPVTFSAGSGDLLSSRLPTSATVNWNNVPDWNSGGEAGYKQQTPELKTIVQEYVNMGGWDSGNAMVFYVGGSGERVASAYKRGANRPLLHIEYTTAVSITYVSNGNDDVEDGSFLDLDDDSLSFRPEWYNGIRFVGVNVPPGAEITKAYIEFTSDSTNSDTTGLRIKIEAHDDPPTFSTSNKPTDRTLSSQVVQWYPVEPWSTYNKYQTPDLSDLVQEIVGRSGWHSGNAMAFVIEHYQGQRYAKATEDPDVAGNPDYVPMLYIEYNDGGSVDKPIITSSSSEVGSSCYQGFSPLADSLTISNSGTADLNFTVSDDASWLILTPSSSSLIPGNSETIALTYATTGLSPGTHTAQILVSDSNATNSPVQITVAVTVLEYSQPVTCGAIPVYAQNLVNPAILILLDRSGSMGNNTVAISTNNPKTPDIRDIIQEIIERDAWASGNAMAFMIDGTGTRRAISYDSNSSAAPLLHVDYTDASGVAQELNIRISHSADDAEQEFGDAPNITSSDLELTYNNYDSGQNQIVGMRFQNVTIEKGSDITNAYIEFVIVGEDSSDTDLVIWGEDLDNPPAYANATNNISNRTKTSTSVAWDNVEPWEGSAQQTRMEVAKEAISELVKDRSIAWGFGTWTGDRDGHDSSNDYTKILEGCQPDSVAHQLALQNAIDGVNTGGMTPYWQSIKVAKDYFSGARDDDNGKPYVVTGCQPKFLIDITDGIGNIDPDDDTEANKNILIGKVRTQTEALADAGVTPIAVGFDLPADETAQTYEMAGAANEKGKASDFDMIYGLHTEKDVDSDGDTEGVPFVAHSKQELIDSLDAITENVKGAIFHGSAAATTTSTDLGNAVIVAKFDASRWTGELEAIRKDANGDWVEKVWSASAVIPSTRSLWTIDPLDSFATQVIQYNDGTLGSDNFACLDPANKPIGDIINSKPVVVDKPPYFYPFDSYYAYSYNMTREPMVYVGANDGALHAFRLSDGAEHWAFFPKSMHDKLNMAGVDPLYDRCERDYCHRYFIDGTPVVGDVFADFGKSYDEWRSLLVVGGREGSTAYFALDVTSGNNFNHATDPTKFLWEFTDSDLGETWSDPSIRRVAKDASTDKTWAVFFGSGYAEDHINQPNKTAYLYGLQAHDAGYLWKDKDGVPVNKIKMADGDGTGTLVYDNWMSSFYTIDQVGETVTGATSGATGIIVDVRITIPDSTGEIDLDNIVGTFIDNEVVTSSLPGGGQALANGNLSGNTPLLNDALASPLLVDMEADYISDRIYIGNLYGDMHRVMDIGKNMTPTVSQLFTFNNTSPYENSIRGTAAFAYAQEKEHIWVYFGTGRFEHQDDKINSTSQYLIGVKDWKKSAYDPPKPLPTYQLSDLVMLQAKYVTATVTIDGSPVDKTFRYIDGDNPDNSPWALELFAQQGDWGWNGPVPIGSERILTKPLVIGGVVYFTTFVPDENVCAGNGETWLLAVDYQTGQVPDYAVFDINGDGMFNDQDYVKVGEDAEGNPIMKPPAGQYVGRGQGSYPVYQDGHLFVTTTGSGDEDQDDGGLTATPINTENISVTLKSWKQN